MDALAGPGRGAADCRGETEICDDGGVGAMGQLSQFLEGGLQLGFGVAQYLGRAPGLLWKLLFGHPEADEQSNEPLLRAVVQVAFDPVTLAVCRSQDLGPRLLEARCKSLALGDDRCDTQRRDRRNRD